MFYKHYKKWIKRFLTVSVKVLVNFYYIDYKYCSIPLGNPVNLIQSLFATWTRSLPRKLLYPKNKPQAPTIEAF